MQIKSMAIAEENMDIVKTEFNLIKCDLRQKRKEKKEKKGKRKEKKQQQQFKTQWFPHDIRYNEIQYKQHTVSPSCSVW